MKSKAKELDVDFIGGQNNPMTKEEQLLISAFIKQLKDNRIKKARRRTTKSQKQSA